MTAVGAIAGLGVANGTLNDDVMFEIVSAWIVAPLVAFWIGVLLGRYIYPHLDARVSFGRIKDGLFDVDRSGTIPPAPTAGGRDQARRRGCGGRPDRGVRQRLLGGCVEHRERGRAAGRQRRDRGRGRDAAHGRRNGTRCVHDCAAHPRHGGRWDHRSPDPRGDPRSLIGATIITVLSNLGIPASLAVSMTSCIIGLGWGRVSRAVTLADTAGTAIEGGGRPDVSAGALVPERADAGAAGTADASSGPAQGPTMGDLAAGEAPERPAGRRATPATPEDRSRPKAASRRSARRTRRR